MKDLPSIPTSVAQILQILDDPDSSAADLSRAISMDQSLTVRILKAVNSAHYGFPRRIDTLDQAVAVLGYRSIRELVLMTSLFNEVNVKSGKASLDRSAFWKHAVGCGLAAKITAKHTGNFEGESVFIAGLLHDIGKVFLDAFLHDEYIRVVEVSQKHGVLLYEAEEKLLGANHTDFGIWLSEEWNLPHNLTSAIMHHHNPGMSTDHYTIVCLVHFGDILDRALNVENSLDYDIPRLDHKAWTALNLSTKTLNAIIDEFLDEMDNLPADSGFGM